MVSSVVFSGSTLRHLRRGAFHPSRTAPANEWISRFYRFRRSAHSAPAEHCFRLNSLPHAAAHGAQSPGYFPTGSLYASFVGFTGRISQWGRRVPSGECSTGERVFSSQASNTFRDLLVSTEISP